MHCTPLQDSMATAPLRDVRGLLRLETADAHDRIDAAYGALAIESEADFTTFLAGHYIAWSCLTPRWSRFVGNTLNLSAPDYAGMIAADLDELPGANRAALALPAFEVPACDLGLAYVLAGSRLGNTVIRRRDNWGKSRGLAQRFLEDDRGAAIFRGLCAHLQAQQLSAYAAERCIASARQTFALFSRSLAAARLVLA